MPYRQIVAPEQELVALGEAKGHLLLTHCSDDPLVKGLVAAARELVEAQARRQFVTATLELSLDRFPSCILLERPPIQSAVITYVDGNGVTQTLADTEYQVDTKSEPGRIRPAYGKSWPTTRYQMNAVTVQFVAGYGDPVEVPAAAKQLVYLLLGHWYEHREAVGEVGEEIELAYCALLNSLKWTM